MATIQFYQKPGCVTNARQKRMLEAAGHTVIARNLLAEPWTEESLARLFRIDAGDRMVQSGRAAREVRRGQPSAT